MSWSKLVKQFGEPIPGKIYVCKLQGAETGTIVEHELKCVDEDDNTWRTTDDNSEISNAWSVIEWKLKQKGLSRE